MSVQSVNRAFSSNTILDSEKYNCRICLADGKTNTIKQYYVNLETTINMCSNCQSTFLMQNPVIVNKDTKTPVSLKSSKKMSLLPYLLKDEVVGNLTHEDAMHLLENAYRSYKRSVAREEQDIDDFLSLAREVLPNHVSSKQTFRSGNKQTLALTNDGINDLHELDGEEVFYFSNGLKLPKQEITDEDIEAAISALSCENSPSMNFEELPDIDSFLDYSSQLTKTVPILSDETLLSPINLDCIKKFNDETLQALNKNQQETGIKISVDFAALENMLAPPTSSNKAQESPDKQNKVTRRVGRYLSKSNFRASDMLLKTQQLHLWKEKSSEETPLSRLHSGLRKVETQCKEAVEENLKSTVPVSSNSSNLNASTNSSSNSSFNASQFLTESNFSGTNASDFCNGQSSARHDAGLTVGSKTYGPKDNLKMFQGFQFKDFEGLVRNEKKVKCKSKKKPAPKVITGPRALYERLKAQSS